MNLLIIQDRIINLENVTCIRRFRPGDRRPTPWDVSQCFSKHTIWIEFAVTVGDSKNFDATAEPFEYHSANAADEQWQRLCELSSWQS